MAAALRAVADVTPASGAAIATFERLACLHPRGRFDVELHPGFLKVVFAVGGRGGGRASICRGWACLGGNGVKFPLLVFLVASHASPNPPLLQLSGEAADFKIQYSSLLRLFTLPKVGGLRGGEGVWELMGALA